MRFKIDWAKLIVGSKFPFFALFYFVFEGNFLSTSPPGGAYIWRGDLTEGFLRNRFGGIILGGAYFSEFYGTYHNSGMLETSQKREWGVMERKTERRESRLTFSSLLITTFDLAFLNEYLKLCSGMTVKVYLNDIILSKFGDYMVSIFYS